MSEAIQVLTNSTCEGKQQEAVLKSLAGNVVDSSLSSLSSTSHAVRRGGVQGQGGLGAGGSGGAGGVGRGRGG